MPREETTGHPVSASTKSRLDELDDVQAGGPSDGEHLEFDATSGKWIPGTPISDSLPVADTTSIVKGSSDGTKKLRFEVDAFTSGQTRVITPPDGDVDLSGVAKGDVVAGTGPGTIAVVSASGASDGDVPTIQADGTLAFEAQSGGGGGSGLQSVVFFTGASGSGTISNKTYEAGTSPSNKILTAFESDDDDITVTLEIHGGDLDDWQPADVTVSGGGATPVVVTAANWTQQGSGRVWTASVNLTDADTTGTLTATMDDGDTATCSYTRALDPPLILTAVIDDHSTNTGGDSHCPAAQTQVKQGDTLDISGTAESHADEVYVIDYEVTNGQGVQGPFAVTAGVWSGTINVGSGTNATANYRCYAKVTGGTAGATFTSTESVDLNQTSPTFGAFSVSYPVGQEAIKGAETCDVTLAHTNPETGDSYLYADPTGTDVIIPSTTSYASPKTGVSINTAGIYRDDDDTANFRLTVTRLQKNGKSASSSGTIEIADTAALIKIDDTSSSYSSGGSVARMGSGSGTGDRNLYVISNQKHLSTSVSSITPDAGDSAGFTGSWTEDDDFTFRRNFRVVDADINAGGQAGNDFTWASPTVTNRAGTETTSITKNPNYSIGGFSARTLTIPAWPNREADIGVIVVDTSRVAAELLSKGGDGANGGTDQTFDNSPGEGLTPDNEVDKFCISNGSDIVDDDGQFYYNKDQAAAIANSSGTAQVIVSESA